MGVGCLLVIMILLVFLFDWRTSLISLTAIPLSLIAASLVLYFTGSTINTMVIAGPRCRPGEVVDNAVLVLENILRRLTLKQSSCRIPLAALVRFVLQASLEVRNAPLSMPALIVAPLFLPVLFLDGISGSFFRPLAIAYILAILASLLVALTVTPAPLIAHAAFQVFVERRRHGVPLALLLKRIYSKILPYFLNRPGFAIFLDIGLFVLTGLGVMTLGQEYLPSFKETDFLMHWVEKPGSSLESMRRITVQVSKELRAIDGVRNFGSHIGRAEVADEVVGPNFTELWISVDPNVKLEPTVAKIEEVVYAVVPASSRDVLTCQEERIEEVLTERQGQQSLSEVYRSDLATLRSKAYEV